MPEANTIKNMFNNISGSYDLLNDVLSLGIHRLWKKALVSEMVENSPTKVLDCATGTGDIAIMIKKSAKQAQVIGSDFSEKMLAQAQKKTTDITWQIQDVMNLTYTDQQFDNSCISYGIRNVENYEQALKEMARVTQKKICILEFGQPKFLPFKLIYFGIMKYFIPFIGKVFNKQEAYQYLIDSSMKFPCAENFCKVIQKSTGFEDVTYRSFFGGITYLYVAKKK